MRPARSSRSNHLPGCPGQRRETTCSSQKLGDWASSSLWSSMPARGDVTFLSSRSSLQLSVLTSNRDDRSFRPAGAGASVPFSARPRSDVSPDRPSRVTRRAHRRRARATRAVCVSPSTIGADPSSLALLPFIEPDVVKLARTCVVRVDRHRSHPARRRAIRSQWRSPAAASNKAIRSGAVMADPGRRFFVVRQRSRTLVVPLVGPDHARSSAPIAPDTIRAGSRRRRCETTARFCSR